MSFRPPESVSCQPVQKKSRHVAASSWLAFARDTDLDAHLRVSAARSLAGVEGHRDKAAALLLALAQDTGTGVHDRVSAAESLARVEGHRKRAETILRLLEGPPSAGE